MIRELFEYFRGEITFLEVIISLSATVFVLFCTLPIHEWAHAKVATMLGDDTPRLMGRLTINPVKHLDPIGSLMILLVGFGYAKPVQVNMRKFKNPRVGMALTAAAGPGANITMSFIFLLFYNIFLALYIKSGFEILNSMVIFFSFAAVINIGLGVFNLLPIPPLDGSRILTLLIPSKYYYKIMRYERYIMYAVLFLIFTGVLTRPLSFLVNVLYLIINKAALKIVALFL